MNGKNQLDILTDVGACCFVCFQLQNSFTWSKIHLKVTDASFSALHHFHLALKM